MSLKQRYHSRIVVLSQRCIAGVRTSAIQWLYRSFIVVTPRTALRVLLSLTGASIGAGFREYCEGEQFRAICYQPDEMVTITRASYGLMSHGRCFDVQYSGVGCYADVTDTLARACSGRRSCDLTVTGDRLKADDCERRFPFFLNASFTCVKGMTACSCKTMLLTRNIPCIWCMM